MSEEDSDGPVNYLDQTDMISAFKTVAWKKAQNISYETLCLTTSQLNCKVRATGFRTNGKMRMIKNTCLLSKIKTHCRIRGSDPKMAICITMYNEDEQELKNTLKGLIHNYNLFRCDRNNGLTKDDFLVCIVCDGYDAMPESFKKFAREKKFLDETVLIEKGFAVRDRDGKVRMRPLRDVMDHEVPDEDVPTNLLHVFQVTSWDFGLDDDVLKGRRINLMFCIKHRNDGKINSHKWFFQGVCKYLKPKLCALFDIGTRPEKDSVIKLYNNMKLKPDCGGCCGEIEVDMSQTGAFAGFSYFVQAAQFYEYKMGHTPDKACESLFGFVSVLPGAYCMFRWKAIKGGPLDMFFKNVTRTETPTCSEANEYLAEDRIMCLQIYIKEHERYTLTYVPDAKALTDAPPSLMVLIKQRRRWMNGALFGTAKVIQNFYNMVGCSRNRQPVYRQCGMFLFMTYMVTLYVLQFFLVGSMFATVLIFWNQYYDTIYVSTGITFFQKLYDYNFFYDIVQYSYLGLLFLIAAVSLSLPVNRGMTYFNCASMIFSLLLLMTIFGVVIFLANTGFIVEEFQ